MLLSLASSWIFCTASLSSCANFSCREFEILVGDASEAEALLESRAEVKVDGDCRSNC